MSKKAVSLSQMISSLSVFREIKDDPAITDLLAFLDAPEGNLEQRLDLISDFAGEVFMESSSFTEYLLSRVMGCDNPYLDLVSKSLPVPEEIEKTAYEELGILTSISRFTPGEAKEIMGYDGYLAGWVVSDIDFKEEYRKMIEDVPRKGYGIFAKYKAFKVKDGELSPVKHMDSQTLDTLYGYDRERKLVLENTRALARGEHASNVLLYGDAGTGKSSTVKACVNELFPEGVRLIEFAKDEIPSIPDVIDLLYSSPLKFIFFIDDLDFSSIDDDFSHLKGILEGTVTGRPDNIVIYATSNRRHLVKEDAADRMGSDIHVNDTLQQMMSLSARFGLTVTFLRPEKDLYLKIVKSLADDAGIKKPEDELYAGAERFAVRNSGRSPRTAKQFIELLKINSSEV